MFSKANFKRNYLWRYSYFHKWTCKKRSLKVVRILVHARPKDRNTYWENKANWATTLLTKRCLGRLDPWWEEGCSVFCQLKITLDLVETWHTRSGSLSQKSKPPNLNSTLLTCVSCVLSHWSPSHDTDVLFVTSTKHGQVVVA